MNISSLLNRINISNLSDCDLLNVLESFEDSVYVTGKNTELIYMNTAAEELFGFKLQDMHGKINNEINENFHYWYPSILIDAYHEKKRYTQEQWSTYNGKKFHTTLIPVIEKNGEVSMVVSLSRVISYSVDGVNNKYKTICAESVSEFSSQSPKMLNVLHQSQKMCNLDTTILLTGETGTGKNMIARYIHDNGKSKDKPFIMINCAAIPANIIETELFGYEPHTFSGGNPKGKDGLIKAAEGGTIFLDEIGELSLKMQPKILGFLQNKVYTKIGGREEVRSNVRVIAATNKNLLEECNAKRFREDLYYRLSVMEIEIPPLRERVEDIKLLVDYFLDENNKTYGRNKKLSADTYNVLCNYNWPGNVRQLKNFFEKLTVTIDSDIIYPQDIAFIDNNKFANQTHQIEVLSVPKSFDKIEVISLEERKKTLEKSLVIEAFEKYKSCRMVAKALSISTTKAHRLINLYCTEN